MVKRRYFFGFLKLQEKWLNNVAQEGWRLVNCNHHKYTFIESKEKYSYNVDILLGKKNEEIDNYINFLNEMGCKTFLNGINLNYSFVKLKWRLDSGFLGHFDSNRGNFNKEILIVEKNGQDVKPLYTTKGDLCNYYANLRNAFIPSFLLFLIAIMDSLGTKILFKVNSPKALASFCGVLLVLLIFIASYQIKIYLLKKGEQSEE